MKEFKSFYKTVEGNKGNSKIHIPEIFVCEDYQPHWKYWQVNVNPNREDCCNLRRT